MSPSIIKDKFPLSGTDEESILSSVSKVLKFDNVVRFNVDARTKVIDFWRVPSEHEAEDDPANPFRGVLKNVQMEEYVPEEDEAPERQFFSMCEMIEDAGCYPVFLLSGLELSKLRKWIPFPRRSSMLGGIPIQMNGDLPKDVILLCGSKTKEAEPIDVTFIVKLTLP